MRTFFKSPRKMFVQAGLSRATLSFPLILQKCGSKTFLVQSPFWSKILLGSINFESEQVLGPIKFWVQTKFGSKQIFGQNNCLVQHSLESKYSFDPKECRVQKNVRFRNVGSKKILVQKKCRVKKIWSKIF